METVIGPPQWIVLLVALQRLAELALARRNTARLIAEGGREIGRRHYPLFVLLHASWLLAIFAFAPPAGPVSWPLIVVFILLQAGRLWVVGSLGRYWTTRLVAHDDLPLVTSGPFRLMRHPNYAIVVLEIAVLPLALGVWTLALVFSLLNGILLAHRIRMENAALAARRPR